MKLAYFKYQIEITFIPHEMIKDAKMLQREQLKNTVFSGV